MNKEWKYDPADLAPYFWGDGGFGLMTMSDFYACAKNHAFWVGILSSMFFLAIESERPS